MTNNDYFRLLLHLTEIGKNKDLIIEIFELGGINATQSKIKGWRTNLDNPRASKMPDHIIQSFIDGLFKYKDEKLKNGINVFNF